MTESPEIPHLTPDEVELWAEGLLGAARTMHLADCRDCLDTAERERRLLREMARLPRFGPEYGFVERVMAHVRVPTPSGDFER
jgi:hypothetical protein